MTELAIEARQLGKRYRLGQTGYATLREKLATRARRGGADDGAREVWALRGLELEINAGDVVGIIGRNGAGKTTFLKTVARIVRPTTGLVRVRGRVGALLEVGTGFHPELTGRENVFLNGVVLGMSRREVARRFDEIVEFAGVERFLDTPLKRYSTGMYLRLAFAVAAHIEPDVVIVDEVLAVGDAEFQRRCLGRMSEFGREGRTVLFVSHDAGAVARLCRSAIWLEQGRIRETGPATGVLDSYLRSTVRPGSSVDVPLPDDGPVRHLSLRVDSPGDTAGVAVRRDDPITVELAFTTTRRIPGLDAAIYVLDETRRQVMSENVSDHSISLDGSPGAHELRLTVPPVLSPGSYVIGVWLGTLDSYTGGESFVHEELMELTVLPLPEDRAEAIRRDRIVQPPVRWEVRER
jgi:ABC-type polysaccharide/polyol phosphate transport system ATPase subunit